MVFKKRSLNPEVFASPFSSIPCIKSGIVS